MRVRWTEAAADSMERIYERISQDSENRAAEIASMLYHGVDLLWHNPMMGRVGGTEGTRELVRPPYVIVYEIKGDVVNVLNVYHGSQMQ